MMKKGSPLNTDMVTDTRPCFFKIYSPKLTTEHLRVPPKFRKHIPRDLSRTAILRGPSGGIWHVRSTKVGDEIFLKDGWQEFARDHSLGSDEFLKFTYDGNSCFDVQIYDANGMERMNMSDPRTRQQPIAPEKHYQARPCHLRQPSAPKKSSEVSCSRQKITLEGIDQPCHEKGKEKAIERKSRRDRKKPITRETRSCSSAKKMPRKEETDLNDQRAADSFTSEFPHLKRCLTTYNVQKSFILNIPTAFARKYLPDEKTEVILRGQKGATWEVTYLTCEENCKFSGGWGAFARDNNLRENDTCIFELVAEKEMNVYIFRSGSLFP